MPPFAIGLLFISAILHTTWNLLLKQSDDKYISTWWAVLAGSALFLPVLLFTGLPARETWNLLVASVGLEAEKVGLSCPTRFSHVHPVSKHLRLPPWTTDRPPAAAG